MFKILIVEDDVKIRKIIFDNITKWGYKADYIEDFNEIFNHFTKLQPHLVLMDINLPNFDGYYWCNKIRQVSKIPIIFISSRTNNMDIIMAMNMGGDDFIQKPFSLDVLMAKINALIRRTYSYSNIESNIIEYNNVILNLKDNNIIYNSNVLELTNNELKIMYILLKNNGNIVNRDNIMRKLWESESFVDDNTLTVNINRLRKKLTSIGLKDYIITKRGQGYIIE